MTIESLDPRLGSFWVARGDKMGAATAFAALEEESRPETSLCGEGAFPEEMKWETGVCLGQGKASLSN